MILLECTVALRDGDRKKLQEQIAAEIGQPVVLLPSGVSRAKERNILFLCDRKACEKCSYPTCRHTPELEHARNFAPAGFTKRTDGVWVEQEGATMEGKIGQDKMVWRWDDIFRVYRCPYCGRPEKPCFELWKKGGLKKSLPSRCTYCKGELEGVEGEEMIIEIWSLLLRWSGSHWACWCFQTAEPETSGRSSARDTGRRSLEKHQTRRGGLAQEHPERD